MLLLVLLSLIDLLGFLSGNYARARHALLTTTTCFALPALLDLLPLFGLLDFLD